MKPATRIHGFIQDFLVQNASGVRPRSVGSILRNVVLGLVLVVGMLPLVVSPAQADTMSGDTDVPESSNSYSDSYVEGEALVVYHSSGSSCKTAEAEGVLSAQSVNGLSIQSVDNDASVLVDNGFSVGKTWNLSAADETESAVTASANDILSVQSDDSALNATASDTRVALVSKDGMDTMSLVNTLEALDFVEVAGPNYLYKLSSLPDDPLLDIQSALVGNGGVSYGSAFDAEGKTSLGDNVIAIIDSGVDYTHPDLKNQMWTNPGTLGLGPAGSHGLNAINGGYDVMPDSSYYGSHGTHCAGIAAAQSNNATGIAGISGANSHTKIMGLKAVNSSGGVDTASAASSYEYMIAAKIAGVNLVAANDSWGGGTFDPVFDYLVNQAGKAGIISLIAAGNSGTDVKSDVKCGALDSPYAIVVGASNEKGNMASFSSYSTTMVDLTAPGCTICSTVPSSCTSFFTPLLSKLLGNTNLDYYSTIDGCVGQTGWKALLTDANGNVLSNEAQAALSLDTQDGSGGTFQIFGENALRISINLDTLLTLGLDPASCQVRIAWTVNNPYYGMTGIAASDYACNMYIMACGDNPKTAWEANAHLLTSSGADCVSEDTSANTRRDNASCMTKQLQDIDTTDLTVTAGFTLSLTTLDEKSGTVSCLASGYGFGKNTDPSTDSTSAFVPYGVASGTSMAAPMITGAVAELAALYPSETALELRGRVCGGTVAFNNSTESDMTASGGRFTFASATNDDLVSANTWSITTDGMAVTVNGYALGDATLTVDGVTITPTSQTDGAITFTANAALFDGAAHRFDVQDASTGRTFKASYRTPDGSVDSLVRLGNLPTISDSATGKLVSATDRLFLADEMGGYLYSTDNPEGGDGSWTKLSAPGIPWAAGSASDMTHIGLQFTYSNGTLYAFCCAKSKDPDGALVPMSTVYYSSYDISSGTWSSYKTVFQKKECVVQSLAPFAQDGIVYCGLAYAGMGYEARSFIAYTPSTGETTVSDFPIAYENLGDISTPFFRDAKLYSIGLNSSGSDNYMAHGLQLDIGNKTLVDLGTVEKTADTSVVNGRSYLTHPSAVTGNGIVILGQGFSELGDAQLITFPVISGVKLGSYQLTTAEGLNPGSTVMYKGKLYLTATDHEDTTKDSDNSLNSVGLYALPTQSASLLTSTDVMRSASAEEGGTATVADWRGKAANELSARENDYVIWTAVAKDNYTFAGWYNAVGDCVSTDVVYAATALYSDVDNATLTAHFIENPTPTPTPTPTGASTSMVASTPTESSTSAPESSTGENGSAFSIPAATGDGLSLPILLFMLTLFSASLVGVVADKRRM